MEAGALDLTLDHAQKRTAILEEGGHAMTYAELRAARDAFAERCREGAQAKQLGLVMCTRAAASIVAYLGGIAAGDAVLLVEAKTDAAMIAGLVETYAPEWIAAPAGTPLPEGYEESVEGPAMAARRSPPPAPIHPDLALLLTTSGTTGSKKLVRLTRRNLEANASAIAEYLALTPEERPLLLLPMSYSFGLSIVNSHLATGATLLLSEQAITTRDLWSFAETARATSLSGVPYTYQVLARLDLLAKLAPPSLVTLTQAGGRLDPALVRRFAEWAAARGGRFFAMYGQTEATARMSYVPAARAIEKAGTIGIPIPGGAMRVDPNAGEIVYSGPNVMMGYAESRADLARGDELHGVLATGDLGAVDADGFFTITGRRSRFVKIVGLRVSLDEIEALLARELAHDVAVVGEDDRLALVVTRADDEARARDVVTSRMRIHASHVQVRCVPEIPRTAKGTFDYGALARGEP